MRVLLVNPSYPFEEFPRLLVTLPYLASALQAEGHEVQILLALEKRLDVASRGIPVDASELPFQNATPVGGCDRRTVPARLLQRCVEIIQVGGRPTPVLFLVLASG